MGGSEFTELLESFKEDLLLDLLPNDRRDLLKRRGEMGSGEVFLNHSNSSRVDPASKSVNKLF